MILAKALLAALSVLLVLPLAAAPDAGTTAAIPHLNHRGTATQLVVQGAPFLVRGGEVRNSSTSSLVYMAPVWSRLAALHLNTVLTPVSWEQLEPEEGKFDFALVDGLIAGARSNRLHLILLWFGSWKNMVSSYAPEWVRSDPRRFPLTVDEAGNRLPVPSTFGANTQAADARAFGALMNHLRQIDATDQTVIMIQVENEVGLPDALRDHSAVAAAAFAAAVPPALTERLRQHPDELTRELRTVWEAAGAKTAGSWAEIFGPGPVANELFMAWHYASYIDGVAAAGRAEYALPLYVNAAIGRKDGKIGSYPGGGALPLAFDLWHLAAPNIDLLSPDIYYGSFSGWCRAYAQLDNPFFVPETRAGEPGAANALCAIGQWNAIGFSPFAIDDHPSAPDEFSRVYGLLEQLGPTILAHQGDGSMGAAILDRDNPAQTLNLGGYRLKIGLRHLPKSAVVVDRGYALALCEAPDQFIVVGKDVEVVFVAPEPPVAVAELARVEEGVFVGGHWVPGRRLNGDEIMLNYDLSAEAALDQTGT